MLDQLKSHPVAPKAEKRSAYGFHKSRDRGMSVYLKASIVIAAVLLALVV